MRNTVSVALLDVMHDVVETLVMVSSEAWDWDCMDHRIAFLSNCGQRVQYLLSFPLQ